MIEKKPSKPQEDRRIETLLKEDLNEALSRFNEFAAQFRDLEDNVIDLQAQSNATRKEYLLNAIELKDNNLETNRIRRGFYSFINDFKNELYDYFDLSRPPSLLQGVADQKQIVKEVLTQRLLRSNYEIDEKDENGKEYEDEGLISDGTSTLIFRLKDVFTGRKLVAQVLKISTLTDELRKEINQVARLKHRNVIKLLNESPEVFPFYIISEYVNGVSLSDALSKTIHRPPSHAADLLCQLTEALDYMWNKGIRHSNARPSKIMVDEESHLMISPFDFVKFGMGARTMKKFYEDCQYLSPEFLKDEGNIFMKQGELTPEERRSLQLSDQFSIGVIAYKMLTGKELFTGDNVMEIMRNRAKFFDPEDESERQGKLAAIAMPKLKEIIERLLQDEPGARYRNLNCVLSEFRALSVAKNDNKDDVLRNSYRRCFANNNAFFETFYDAFFKGMPEQIRSHFGNRERQQAMMTFAIDVLLDIDQEANATKFREMLEGDRHNAYTVNQFKTFLQALIQTAKNNDYDWDDDPQIETAWKQMQEKTMSIVREKLKKEKTNKR